jgi:hypothetical protein
VPALPKKLLENKPPTRESIVEDWETSHGGDSTMRAGK